MFVAYSDYSNSIFWETVYFIDTTKSIFILSIIIPRINIESS